jgi:hypothetical protein
MGKRRDGWRCRLAKRHASAYAIIMKASGNLGDSKTQ